MARGTERHRTAEARYWRAEAATPSERYVPLPRSGTRIRVQCTGDGPDVLFIHGGSTSGTGWAPLASRLPSVRCLLADRPGCGFSEPLPAPKRSITDFEPFADDLVVDMMDALGIERAHVIATSLGGYFALRAAATHPTRIDRMVLLAFPVGAEAHDTPLSMRLTAVPGLGAAMSRLPASNRMARTMLKQLGLGPALDEGRLPGEGVDWFRSLINDTPTMRNEIAAMPPVMHPRHGLSPELVLGDDLLGRIEAPTLFLWGTSDPIGGSEVARAFAPKVTGSQLELLEGVGHVPWLDDPEHVALRVTGWLGASPG